MKAVTPIALIVIIVAIVVLGSIYFFRQNANQIPSYSPGTQTSTSSQNIIQQIQNQFGFSNLPSCGSNDTFFSVPPVNISDITTLAPLGQMTPPDHVFPAPHNYIYVIDVLHPQDKSVKVYSPGDLTLTQIEVRHYNQIGNAKNYIDYTLVFQPCAEFYLYFHHVTSLSYQPFIDAAQKIMQTCTFSTTKNEDICNGQINIPIKAGTIIGTAGNLTSGTYGLDIGARDYRISSGKNFANSSRFCSSNNFFDRCYDVCAFDYFPDSIRSQFKFSGYDGTLRTADPVCGTVYDDIPNSAQGYWFTSGQATMTFSPESDNLFLGHDNINPAVKVLSVGNKIPNVQPGKYVFIIADSGFANRDFKDVTQGNVYCYDTYLSNGPSTQIPTGSQSSPIIIQLTSPTTIRVEKLNGQTCGNGPWSFDSNYADFQR